MNLRPLLLTLAICSFVAVGTFAYGQNQPATNPAPQPAASQPETSQPANQSTMTLPAGTQISVRNDDAIDSQNASPGQTYSATVVQDVQNDAGAVLIPKDSPAELSIRKASGGGTFGSSELSLDLKSVTVDGQRYDVSTESVTQKGNKGIGKNKRTAEMVGGGAVLGTLLGAIAGGGKGAALGAIAGGAAGGATQVLTRGKRVRVPSETILSFKLEQPLQLTRS